MNNILYQIEKVLFRLGSEVINLSKEYYAPYRTGNLARDIQVLDISHKTVTIGNTKKAYYAKFVHEGTKRYVIKVKNKKVLSDRKRIFGKTVNHPGIKANPYLDIALQNYIKKGGFDIIKRDLKAIISDVISFEIKKNFK